MNQAIMVIIIISTQRMHPATIMDSGRKGRIVLTRMVSKDETFEQRSELSKGTSCGVIWGRAVLAEEITNVKVLR